MRDDAETTWATPPGAPFEDLGSHRQGGRPRARERSRMRRRLRQQRQMREALLLDLGALVFELHRQGRREPRLLQAKAAEVSAVDAEVRALSHALEVGETVHELVAAGIAGTCERCGALLSIDARYCAACGTPALEAGLPAAGLGHAGPVGESRDRIDTGTDPPRRKIRPSLPRREPRPEPAPRAAEPVSGSWPPPEDAARAQPWADPQPAEAAAHPPHEQPVAGWPEADEPSEPRARRPWRSRRRPEAGTKGEPAEPAPVGGELAGTAPQEQEPAKDERVAKSRFAWRAARGGPNLPGEQPGGPAESGQAPPGPAEWQQPTPEQAAAPQPAPGQAEWQQPVPEQAAPPQPAPGQAEWQQPPEQTAPQPTAPQQTAPHQPPPGEAGWQQPPEQTAPHQPAPHQPPPGQAGWQQPPEQPAPQQPAPGQPGWPPPAAPPGDVPEWFAAPPGHQAPTAPPAPEPWRGPEPEKGALGRLAGRLRRRREES